MTDRNQKLKANPIIEAAKTKVDGRIQKLVGYLGQGIAGKFELYLSLDMEICLELDEEDVIHFVEAEKPTEPSLVFVRDKARIVMRQDVTASYAAVLSSHSCACGGAEGSDAAFLAARRRQGGTTGSPDLDCAITKAGCKIKCWLKYPNDPHMQSACDDSCDAADRLCRTLGSFGGGGGFIF
jgi:hypothetical protein